MVTWKMPDKFKEDVDEWNMPFEFLDAKNVYEVLFQDQDMYS